MQNSIEKEKKSIKNCAQKKEKPSLKSRVYAADFETLTTEPTEVYMWGICNIKGENYENGETCEGFLATLYERYDKSVIYFHNAKFDTSFILCCLEKEGWEISSFLYTGKEKRFRKLVISKNGVKIEFRDSAPLFAPSAIPLQSVLRSWCKNYTSKGELKLRSKRSSCYSDDEWDYLEIDVKGLAEALQARFSVKNSNKLFLTTSAQAKELCKSLINRDLGASYFEKKIYPSLKFYEDSYLRKFYRGGFVYVNPKILNKKLENVTVYDVNSMYPSIMKDEELPFGAPKFEGGRINASLFCQEFVVKWAFLKEGKIPFIVNGATTAFGSVEYLSDISEFEDKERRTLYLTNIELELFKECYDYEIEEYVGGYSFESSNLYFKTYIEEFLHMKETSTGARREFAKLCLNAPSGKWGQNPEGMKFRPEVVDGVVKYIKDKDDDNLKPFYLPTSIFITSYARVRLIREILRIGKDNFCYCDTDSIHVLSGAPLDIHDKRLGAWKKENIFSEAKYCRTKRYCGRKEDGSLKIVIAGINERNSRDKIKTLDDFYLGQSIIVKRGKNVRGGVIIIDTEAHI